MKRVVISSVVTLLIILLVGAGFYYFNKSSLFKSEPLSAVPPDAAFVLSGQHAGKMLDQLFRNEAWKSLGHATGGSTVGFLDSLFRGGPGAWADEQLVLSVHVTKAGSFDCLFLVNTSSVLTDAALSRRLEEMAHGVAQNRRYENVTIREAKIGSRTFAYAVCKGVLISSFTSFLVEDAIRQLKSGSPVDQNPAFRVAIAPMEGGETVCYVNYAGLGMLAANLGASQAEPVTQALAAFAGWSALETNFQRQGVLLSGYTAPADSGQLAALFTDQSPVISQMNEVVPGRTAFLLSFGFSNSARFFDAVSHNTALFPDTAARRNAMTRLGRDLHTDVEAKMTAWIGSHIALLVAEAGNTNFNNNSYLCIEAARTEDARKKLEAFRKQVNRETGIADKQETYRNHSIGFLNIPELAPLLFGKPFSRISKFYYTLIRNYVVVGNTASALRSFIDDYEEGRTLSASAPAKEALASLSNAHNLFLYMHLPALHNVLRSYGLAGDRSQRPGTLLQAFTTVSASLGNGRDGMQTSIFWNRIAGEAPGIRLIASARLDTAVAMEPCIFPMPSKEQQGIAVQDASNVLYLLDETGEVIWKKPLPEAILGKIHPVDFFRNGDVQLFFITASAMHLLDLEGAYTGNFPIRLPAPALAGATVIPSDVRGPERIYISCRNGQVYAYEISGKPLDAWSYNGLFSGMENAVLHFVASKKNYLVLYNAAGEVKCLDENGADAGLWPAKPFDGIRGRLKVIQPDTVGQALLACLDPAGHIVTLTADGRIKSTGLAADSTVFDFTIWPGPGNETVYLSAGTTGIHAFDATGMERFRLPLEANTSSFFQQQVMEGNGMAFINGAGKIFYIGTGGLSVPGFPVKGFTPIGVSGPLSGNGRIWVTGDPEGTLYIYEIH